MKSYFVLLLFVLASLTTSHDTAASQHCLAITECENKIAEIPLPTASGSVRGVPGKRGPPGAKGDQGMKGEPGDPYDVEDQLAGLINRLSRMENEQNAMKNEQKAMKKQLARQSTDFPQQISDLKETVIDNEEELNDTNKQVTDIQSELTLGLDSLQKQHNATEQHLNQETAEFSRLEEELRKMQTQLAEEKLASQAQVFRLEEELRSTQTQLAEEKTLSQEFQKHLVNVTEKLTMHEEQHLNDTKEQVTDVQSDIVRSSCLDLINAGKNRSGIYEVQPRDGSSTLQVFCDMEVDGGGWTLVASVHENNIDGKCTIGDNWSNDQGTTGSTSSSSWSNTRIFGNVEGATSDDYKNEAYFNIPANDVMIWHVPNNNPSSQWSNLASLKYFTNNSFLTQYGSNLRDLYKNHFPMERQEGLHLVLTANLDKYTATFEEKSSYIRSAIPSFYSYTYDDNNNNQIKDGGSDMYDNGNKVSVRSASSDWHRVVYDATHHDTDWSVTSTTQTHPFLALMYIENLEGHESYFEIKVESGTGADGSGTYSSYYTVDLSYDHYNMKYKTYNVYGADGSDPSICEVYFVVYSTEMGSIVSGSNFFSSNEWSSSDDKLVNSMRVNNNPRKVFLGYTLFSKSAGVIVSPTEVRNAMLQFMADFSQNFNSNCSRMEESVVAPIIFHTGTQQTVTNRIPSAQQSLTTAGFIQLRALNSIGYPFAMCPGVKTESCNPSAYCIGSISMDGANSRSCGDFTDGTSTFHHINSSILIFTRN